MLTCGLSIEDIHAIPMTHLLDLAYLFRAGVIGWQSDARHSYAQYAQLHNLQQILIQVNSKNHKGKKPPSFDKLFPEHADLARLKPKAKLSLADKWMAASQTLGAHDANTNRSKPSRG